jgi:hypothetical protein
MQHLRKKKKIIKTLGNGQVFKKCLKEAIDEFENSEEMKLLSILIQESLILSSRECQYLRLLLAYHYDFVTKKLVRNMRGLFPAPDFVLVRKMPEAAKRLQEIKLR